MHRALRLAVGWILLALAGLCAGELIDAAGPRFDAGPARDLHVTAHGSAVGFWRAVTFLGSPPWLDAVFAIAVIGLLLRRRWGLAGWLLLASPGAVALADAVRAVVARHRPTGAHLTYADGFSFPSGHAADSTALYGALVLLAFGTRPLADRPRLRTGLLAAVVVVLMLIGISRVTLGVHFPSDVVAGWLLSAGWLAVLRPSVVP